MSPQTDSITLSNADAQCFPRQQFLIDVQEGLQMADHSQTKSDQPGNVDIHVGRRLKLRRIMLGISQEDLASAVSIGPHDMHEYEEGRRRISANRLCRFAVRLHVPIAWFFEALDDMPEVERTDAQAGR